MEPILKEIYDGIIDADQELVNEKVSAALTQGLDAGTILNQGMVPAMTEVGRLFEEGEFFVPEMLICARAMQAGLLVLKPAMIEGNVKSAGKVVAGTVKGDLHDIGKNLVCMMLEGAAFEIFDLGSDVSPQAFVEKAKEVDADFIAMSALLTTTMPNMKATIEALKEAGLRDKVKVLVGGAPLTTKYCEEIGADGYAADASRAVAVAKSLIGAQDKVKMENKSFLERIRAGQILVLDGATGTNLQQRGLDEGKAGEYWVVERPEEIIRLHKDFIAAGSDIILTCTFGATSIRLAQDGWGERAVEINQKAVELAHEAVKGTNILVAGSMGPTGQMLKPLGTMEEDICFNSYQQQAKTLSDAGVDLLVVETQYDLNEAGLAVKAARSVSDLPLVCSFSYDRGKRTMMGVKPTQMAQAFADNVDVLGINCGRSLEDNLAALGELRAASTLPIWFKPNAGLPQVDADGKTTFNVTPEEMGSQVSKWIKAGASVVGGCCGSSPEHIHQIAVMAKN